jgi:peptidylprolyl isomerase
VSVRKLPALVVAAGLMVSLTSCAGGPFDFGGCAPAFATGGNSALVSADGSFADDPEAEFPTPLVATSTDVSVVEKGDGQVVRAGEVLDTTVTIYDGSNGESLILPSPIRLTVDDINYKFGEIAECATVGSRVAAVGTAGDLLGEDVIAANQGFAALDVDQAIAVVMDVDRSFLGRANGSNQFFAGTGFPAIVLAPNGQPGFTFPSDTIPTELRYENLKNGSGATVKEGDQVVVHYTGVLWDTKTVFDSSWDRGVPSTFGATDGEGGVVPGFAKALIGQKVGSQVIVVIPPEFGYPAGSAPESIPEGSTMVFVFDVLGIE